MTAVLPYERTVDAETDDVAIHVENVVKTYGAGDSQVVALRGVDLDVKAGELMMLVGPSGCGKTTLISVIAGILDPDEGECRVFGRDYKQMSTRDKTRFRGENIGFVFQQYNLLPTLSAAENACIPLLIAGRPRKEALARTGQVLDALGLGDRLRSLPSQLSGGQQQRVAIARALVHEPKLLVCDEPTAALDAQSGRVVMGLIRRVAVQPDRAVIVVTHDSRVYDFGDRIVSMSDGRIERVEERPASE